MIFSLQMMGPCLGPCSYRTLFYGTFLVDALVLHAFAPVIPMNYSCFCIASFSPIKHSSKTAPLPSLIFPERPFQTPDSFEVFGGGSILFEKEL